MVFLQNIFQSLGVWFYRKICSIQLIELIIEFNLLTTFGNKINNILFHYVKLWGDFNMGPVFSEEARKAFYFGPYKWKNRQFNSKQIKAKTKAN